MANRATYAGEIRIVVVDAGSTDGSIEFVRRLQNEIKPGEPWVSLIVEPGCLESEGQMTGVRAYESDVVMFTNSDIYVPSNWVVNHVAWIGRGYDVVGGRCLWSGDRFTYTWNMEIPRRISSIQIAGIGLGFSNAAMRRDYLLQAGGLKRMVAHQDTEFAFSTLKNHGKLVIDYRIRVIHDHPFKSIRGSFWRSYGYARNHIVVMRLVFGGLFTKRPTPAGEIAFSMTSLVMEVPYVKGILAWKEARLYPFGRYGLSLPQFLLVRWFGWLLGHIWGTVAGLLVRDVTLDSIQNLHTSRIGGKA